MEKPASKTAPSQRKYHRNHYTSPTASSYMSYNHYRHEEEYREIDRDCAQISRLSYVDMTEVDEEDEVAGVEPAWWIFYNVHKRVYFRAPVLKDTSDEVVIKWKFSPNCIPTCHSMNPSTKTPRSLEVLLGFSNGMIFLFSPFDDRVKKNREKRIFNSRDLKDKRITTSRCTDVKWVPKNIASPFKNQMRYKDKYLHCFAVSHADGYLYVYDRRISDSEDNEGPFPPLQTAGHRKSRSGSQNSTSSRAGFAPPTKHSDPTANRDYNTIMCCRRKSRGDDEKTGEKWDFRVSKMGQTRLSVRSGRCTTNPVEMWHISRSCINGIAFNSTGELLATVQNDGTLQIFDFSQKKLKVVFQSYYGGLTCLCWSPDDKFILTGGEDDLITLWNPHTETVVARGQGHESFVSSVSFQPEITTRSYRYSPVTSPSSNGDYLDKQYNVYSFVSVGQDPQVIFWKYEDVSTDTVDLELEVKSAGPEDDRTPGVPVSLDGSHNSGGVDNNSPDEIEPPSRKDVLMLTPEGSHRVHDNPISSVLTTDKLLITLCDDFHLRIWHKPDPKNKHRRPSKSSQSRTSSEARQNRQERRPEGRAEGHS